MSNGSEKRPENPPHRTMADRLTDAEAELRKLSGRKTTAATRRKPVADRIAQSLDALAHRSEDPAAADFREELFGELRKLIPSAIAQAKKGKPALLRILCRYTR